MDDCSQKLNRRGRGPALGPSTGSESKDKLAVGSEKVSIGSLTRNLISQNIKIPEFNVPAEKPKRGRPKIIKPSELKIKESVQKEASTVQHTAMKEEQLPSKTVALADNIFVRPMRVEKEYSEAENEIAVSENLKRSSAVRKSYSSVAHRDTHSEIGVSYFGKVHQPKISQLETLKMQLR